MRVDVQLDDSVLALLSGYNRSTTMGIKKPGELQRELLSDMENIEEKREAKVTPEERGNKQGADAGTVESKEVASASEDEPEEAKSAPVRVRSDFLSMLSAMAQPNTHEDKDPEGAGENVGILPEDTDDEDEDVSVLPEDGDEEDESVLPEDEDEDEEDGSVLPDDEDEEDGSVLPEDDEDEDEDVSTLPADDDEYDEDAGILPADDEGAEGDSVASEESTSGIPEQQEEEYSSELPEDDDDEEYSSELPADEEDYSELPADEEDSSELPSDEDDEEDSSELPDDENGYSEPPADEDDEEDSSVLPDDDADDYSVLPSDEGDEEDASVLPDDEDEESSVLPEGNEEVEDDFTPAGIQETPQEYTAQPSPKVVEHPVSPSPKVQKSVHHVANQPTAHPVGYSAPSVSLYDFILNNGGSMLIEDVKKYYPIDEVKKALNLGKIYRFGNKVGV